MVRELPQEGCGEASGGHGEAERHSGRRANAVRQVLLCHDDDDAERDVEGDPDRDQKRAREPDVAGSPEGEEERRKERHRDEDDDAPSVPVGEAAAEERAGDAGSHDDGKRDASLGLRPAEDDDPEDRNEGGESGVDHGARHDGDGEAAEKVPPVRRGALRASRARTVASRGGRVEPAKLGGQHGGHEEYREKEGQRGPEPPREDERRDDERPDRDTEVPADREEAESRRPARAGRRAGPSRRLGVEGGRAEPHDGDRGGDESVEGRDAGEGEAGAGGGDPDRDEPSGGPPVREPPEERLGRRGRDVRGERPALRRPRR